MNRVEFMRQLEHLLQSIPEAERAEALQYYNDYFDDAGVENEKEVLNALGNPAKVAENIKRDLYGDLAVQSSVKNPPVKYQDPSNKRKEEEKSKKKVEGGLFAHIGAWYAALPDWGQILAIIGLVLFSPVIVGIASAVVGALFSLVAGWFSLIIGFGAAALTLLAILFCLVIIGIMCAAETPFAALALAGTGLICGGLGLLFLMLTVAMAGIVTPAIFRGIVSLCRMLFSKKEVTA